VRLGFLVEFVAELRSVGIAVSMVEATDAAEALRNADVRDRSEVHDVLAATLVKSHRHTEAFDAAFDAFFSLLPPEPASPAGEARDLADWAVIGGRGGAVGSGEEGEGDAIIAALLRGVLDDDDGLVQAVIRQAVTRLAGMEAGRPVGGSYYVYRVLSRLDLDRLRDELVAGVHEQPGSLERRLAVAAIEMRLEQIRQAIRQEVTKRLVVDRGHHAVARTLRRPPVEDLDLTTATREDLARIEAAVQPLTRKLATRLAQRRRLGSTGRLDVRRTVRRSLSTGGVLVEPRFRKPRPGRPDIVLLADVSGSVATFARFTMQMVHAISSQLHRVRSFAFIDGVDEVTGFFGPGVDFSTAMQRIGSEAEVVWMDGHSNYGHAFDLFAQTYEDALSPRSTVIITGDARTNYHEPNVDALGRIASRVRAVCWLDPEPRRYWDTGDSVIGLYAPVCDAVYEVRTLRQLESFVAGVALPSRGPVSSPA
jgi:uncharacterized protein